MAIDPSTGRGEATWTRPLGLLTLSWGAVYFLTVGLDIVVLGNPFGTAHLLGSSLLFAMIVATLVDRELNGGV